MAPAMSDIETKLRAVQCPPRERPIIDEAADTIASLRKQVSDAVGALEEAEFVVDALDRSGYSQGDVLATIRSALATLTGGKADA